MHWFGFQTESPTVQSGSAFGWISTLKDTFGFIEAFNHASEIFFHFSELLAPLESYKVAIPVSFVMGIKGISDNIAGVR